MPDPRRILTTVKKAAELFARSPGRSGLIVDLPSAPICTEVLVVGDLHGNLTNFRAALSEASLSEHKGRHIVFQEVVHGPFRYQGNGCTSHQLVDLIAALKCQYPERVHYIPGNHEIAELRGKTILKNGEKQDLAFREGLRHAYGDYADEIHEAYRTLFASLPLILRTPNGVLIAHSLPDDRALTNNFDMEALKAATLRDVVLERGGPVYALLWGRRTSPDLGRKFLERLSCSVAITGHLPSPEGYQIIDDYRLVLDASQSPAYACLVPTASPIRDACELARHLVRLS